MAEKKKMSVQDILAAARQQDSGQGASPEKAAPSSESAPQEQSAAGTSPAQAAKPPGSMSTADILAAARAEKAKAEGGSTTPQQPAESGGKPAAGKPAAGKPGTMSVKDILAAARAEKEKGQGEKAAPQSAAPAAAKPQPAPKSKPAAEKTSAEPAASGPKDTASILAAVRKSDKPGPISKSEAVERDKPVPAAKPAKVKPSAPPMPAKPDYARPAAARSQSARSQAAGETERRGFLAAFFGVLVASPLAIGFSSLAVTHLLWVLGLARFMFPNILTEPPTRFKVGFPDEYAPGQVETKFKAQFGVWVVRAEFEGEPQIFALKTVCTHLGCTPNWLDGEQKFKCPCHGSGFYKDGINFEGPAPRPLERYAIQVADDGQLEVDKSRKFQQELGQWADSSSFVPV